jgi:signal transduction histidine kinase
MSYYFVAYRRNIVIYCWYSANFSGRPQSKWRGIWRGAFHGTRFDRVDLFETGPIRMTRILVAEDSPTQAVRLVAALEDRGFDVASASDGKAALALYGSGDFDMVLSDVVMPGLTGYELCRAIKSDRSNSHIPVVLMTSLREPMEVIRGLECGADNFVRKPYDTDDLISRVDTILENYAARQTAGPGRNLDFVFMGHRFSISSDRAQILDLLISTFEETVRTNLEIERARSDLMAANTELASRAEQLETRVRERTGELAAANDTLRGEIGARKSAEKQLVHAQKMDAIGTLTGGIAHDFNNLLGVIIGNLDLLTTTVEASEDGSVLVNEALDAALSGAELTRRLLAFARHQPLKPERVEINTLVEETAKLLQRVLGEDIEVTLDLDAELWPVVVDPAQLESSLMNLATNARDAMPGGGKLRIFTRNRTLDADYAACHDDVAAGDYAMIAVNDSGTGMPPEVVSRIFEPFFTTKADTKGTGLGLAMVFGFMKQSAGHINVYSEPGSGTVFRLYVPRSTADNAAARPNGRDEAPQGAGETVLAVEDNPAMRKILAVQLRALNYRVLEAASVSEALERLERQSVDVLVSDIVMPGGLSGIDLARRVNDRWPDISILLTSGFAAPLLFSQLESIGKVRILSKPYRRADLAREVQFALHAPRE